MTLSMGPLVYTPLIISRVVRMTKECLLKISRRSIDQSLRYLAYKNRLQTDGQTHMHDRVHNQPPPDGWRMIIKYSRVKGKVNANEKLKTSNARIPTSSYALWKGL